METYLIKIKQIYGHHHCTNAVSREGWEPVGSITVQFEASGLKLEISGVCFSLVGSVSWVCVIQTFLVLSQALILDLGHAPSWDFFVRLSK